MLAVVVVLAVVAVAAIVAAFVVRGRLATERGRLAAAEAATSELGVKLATTEQELTTSRESLAAETSAHAADTQLLDQARADVANAERLAAEADRRARDAAAAAGVEPSVVWPLELRRSERVWRFSVSPGPHADSPLAATAAPLIAALKVEVDAARNDVGADVELAADVPPEVEPAAAVLVLRTSQELLADVVRRSESATLRVGVDGDDIVVTIDAVGRDGEPVLPEPLPVESPRIEAIDNGVRLLGCAPATDAPATDTPAADTEASGAVT